MKKYNCGPCNYSTELLSNYKRHNESDRHKDKVNQHLKEMMEQIEAEKKLKSKVKCDDCNAFFSCKSSLTRHKKLNQCKAIKNANTEVEDKVTSKDIKNIYREIEKIKNENAGKTLIFNGDVYFVMALERHIIDTYTDTPPLQLMDKSKLPENDLQEDVPNIIDHYKKHTLHEHLGKRISSYYKKDNPKLQQVFYTSVDRSAKKLLVRHELNTSGKINEWLHDDGGKIFRREIVDEYLKSLKNLLITYSEYKGYKVNIIGTTKNCTTGKKTNEEQNIIVQIIDEINSGYLAKTILDDMSEDLHVLENKTLKETDKKKLPYARIACAESEDLFQQISNIPEQCPDPNSDDDIVEEKDLPKLEYIYANNKKSKNNPYQAGYGGDSELSNE